MAANNNTNIPGLLPAAAQAALNAAYLANHPNPLALINQLHPLGVNPGAPVIDSPDKELLIESEAGEQLVQEVGQQNMRSMIKKCYEEDRVITKDMVDIWGQVRANIAEYRAKCKILSRPETAAIGSELRSGRPDLQQQALVKAANVMEVKRTLKFLATKIHRQRGEYLVLGKIRYRKFKRRMLAERQPFVKAELEYKEQLRLYRNSRLAAPEEYPGVSGEERGVLGGEWNAPPEYEIDYDV